MIYIGKYDLSRQGRNRLRKIKDQYAGHPIYSIQMCPYPVSREWKEAFERAIQRGFVKRGKIPRPERT
jgi:hypothetical protein